MFLLALIVLQAGHPRASIVSRLVGEWSYVKYPNGISDSVLTLKPEGRFVITSLLQTRPIPPQRGHYRIENSSAGRLTITLNDDTVRTPGHPSKERRLSYLAGVPALVDGAWGGFVPARDLNAAARRLVEYWRVHPMRRSHAG